MNNTKLDTSPASLYRWNPGFYVGVRDEGGTPCRLYRSQDGDLWEVGYSQATRHTGHWENLRQWWTWKGPVGPDELDELEDIFWDGLAVPAPFLPAVV